MNEFRVVCFVILLGMSWAEVKMAMKDDEDQPSIKHYSSQEDYMKDSFAEMDENDDGLLEEKEMLPYLADRFEKIAVMDTSWMFEGVDTDKSGYVEHKELTQESMNKSPKEVEEALKAGKLSEPDQWIYNYEKEKFHVCDKNKDNKLSPNEYWYFLNLGNLWPKFEVDNQWGQYDKNHDGKVTFDEFHNPAYRQPEQTPERHKATDRAFFDERDQNKDGILDYNEVKEMFHPDRKKQAKEHFDHVIEKSDKNKDNKLSLEEYKSAKDEMIMFAETSMSEPPPLKSDDVEGMPKDPNEAKEDGAKKDEL